MVGDCGNCDCAHAHDKEDDEVPFMGIRLKRPSSSIPAKAIFIQHAQDEGMLCYAHVGYQPSRHGPIREEEEFRVFKMPRWEGPETEIVGSTAAYKNNEMHETGEENTSEEEEWDYFLYVPVDPKRIISPALLHSAAALPLNIDERDLDWMALEEGSGDDEDYDPEDSNDEAYYTHDYPDEEGDYYSDEDYDEYDEEYSNESEEGYYGESGDGYDESDECDDDFLPADKLEEASALLDHLQVEVDDDGKCLQHHVQIEDCGDCLDQQENFYEMREELAGRLHAQEVMRQITRQMYGLGVRDDDRIQEVHDDDDDDCEDEVGEDRTRYYWTKDPITGEGYGSAEDPDGEEEEE